MLYTGRARVAAISERVIMMSRMPRPRAILAPRLRAMVAAMFEMKHCVAMGRQLRDAGPNLLGATPRFVVPAGGLCGSGDGSEVLRRLQLKAAPAAAPRGAVLVRPPRRGASPPLSKPIIKPAYFLSLARRRGAQASLVPMYASSLFF